MVKFSIAKISLIVLEHLKDQGSFYTHVLFYKMKAYFTFYQHCNYISLKGCFTEAYKRWSNMISLYGKILISTY